MYFSFVKLVVLQVLVLLFEFNYQNENILTGYIPISNWHMDLMWLLFLISEWMGITVLRDVWFGFYFWLFWKIPLVSF